MDPKKQKTRLLGNRSAAAIGVVLIGVLIGHAIYGMPIRTARMQEKNPTAFEFPVEKRAVLDAICSRPWEDLWLKNGLSLNTNDHGAFGRDVLAQPGNEDDIYLTSFHFPITDSPVYRSLTGKQLPFTADFHVHVVTLGPFRTRVEVRALNAEVINGSYFSPGIHGFWQIRYVAVAPTTIEEYRILRSIGEALGEKQMPPIRIPE